MLVLVLLVYVTWKNTELYTNDADIESNPRQLHELKTVSEERERHTQKSDIQANWIDQNQQKK